MKDIKVVIGANFGDEGKGLMTDYFSQNPNTVVICSNGGAQRGHTVVAPDNTRHVFHHFGSGTLNDAATYLPEMFIVNPIIFKQEYDELSELNHVPITYVHSGCMVTTPFDMMANQIIEESRGKNKHGSCGLGIFETIKRYRAGITDLDYQIRDYYVDLFKKENIILSPEWSEIFYDKGIFEHFLEDWDFMNNHITAVPDESFLNQFDHIVFEAAQGLLLDQNNIDYFPNLTPSNTGIKNPKEIIESIDWIDDINIEVCFVTRTYMTRHGAGRFPSECEKSVINADMFDKTNVPNPHQDTLRYGELDLKLLYDRCIKEVCDFECKKSLAVTHCNEYELNAEEIVSLFNGWTIYYSDGETHNDVGNMLWVRNLK